MARRRTRKWMVVVTTSLACTRNCSGAFTPNRSLSRHSSSAAAACSARIRHDRDAIFTSTTQKTRSSTHDASGQTFAIADSIYTAARSPWLTRLNAVAVDDKVDSRQELAQEHSAKHHWVPSTMRQALTTFFLSRAYNGPRTIVLLLLGLGLGWLQTSTHPVTECAVALTTVVFWWFQEHWMHQHLLHSRNDWIGKQVHEQHHDKHYFHISIDPAPLMLGWFGVVIALLAWMLPSWPMTLAAAFGYGSAGLFYEWSHFIVHTKVRFRSDSFWQKMKDHHIRHHRVDSSYWLAFSVRQVDDLFGTNPDVALVRRQKGRRVVGK